jgi:hypothetical protein
MPYAYWFGAITDRTHHEHQKILNQSISIFSAAEFLRLLGKQRFIDTWREVREDIDTQRTSTRQGKVILDGLWSMMVTGFAFSKHAFKMQKPISKQLKATYVDICSRSTKNIYQVARDMNRPYSRVYADVKRLQGIGLVNASSTVQAGKRVTLLSAA